MSVLSGFCLITPMHNWGEYLTVWAGVVRSWILSGFCVFAGSWRWWQASGSWRNGPSALSRWGWAPRWSNRGSWAPPSVSPTTRIHRSRKLSMINNEHFIRNTKRLWWSLKTGLDSSWDGFHQHFFEILLHVDMIASLNLCRSVGCGIQTKIDWY